MEVRVDVRKLQLLNDRINQCMDALQQVRFGVQGISHTPQYNVQQPYGPVQGLSHTPQYMVPMPMTATPQPFLPVQGLTHTPQFYTQPLVEQELFRGLSHTSPWNIQERLDIERTNDPYRIAQTFPYAFARIPPVSIW